MLSVAVRAQNSLSGLEHFLRGHTHPAAYLHYQRCDRSAARAASTSMYEASRVQKRKGGGEKEGEVEGRCQDHWSHTHGATSMVPVHRKVHIVQN